MSSANALDASPGLQPVLPLTAATGSGIEVDLGHVSAMAGLVELLKTVKLLTGTAQAVHEDLEELGAINVKEPNRSEWESLAAWALFKPLQKKRFLQYLGL